MTLLPERTRPTGCLSDFRLDAIVLGGLPADQARAAEEHVAECPHCTKRLAELRADAASFDLPLPALPPVHLPVSAGRVQRMKAIGAGATAAFALAAAVLLFLRGAHRDETGDESVRTKGGAAHVGFFVEHAGRLRRGFPGEKVQPGDKLQFAVATREPAFVAVVSIDGARASNVYYTSTSPLGPTTGDAEQAVPVSILLDDVLGDEQLWGLVCSRAQSEADLRRRLQSDAASFTRPAECTLTAWTITKTPRSP